MNYMNDMNYISMNATLQNTFPIGRMKECGKGGIDLTDLTKCSSSHTCFSEVQRSRDCRQC